MTDKLINVQEHVFENNSVKETTNEAFIEKKENTSKLSHIKEKKSIVDVLKFVSPGTAIRTALDDILHAGLGALIVFEKEGLSSIIDGGFRINCRFSPQKLVELTKMDGAVIISEDLKKILYANALLNPSVKIKTKETGTRHKAAERTSKQFQTIAIAVSERRNKITLYYGDENFYIEETSEILRRAAETIQILEKQKDIFDELLSHLNVLEITNLTTMSDVCSVLQTIEIIRRISESVKRYLIELGKEGLIISMRLKELTKNLSKNRESILNDYFGSVSLKKDEMLHNMNFDFLLENLNVLRILFDELHDNSISSRGMRILGKTNLLEKDIKIILDNFKTLDEIFNLNRESLRPLFNNEDFIDSFLTEIKNLKEKILMGKKI
ncbi:MAG: DNA integrity scanning diadenylate cyclase DisA [Nanoarchaeota archaeon]